MIFKDGKTFSAYVRSKLHSGYITITHVLIFEKVLKIVLSFLASGLSLRFQISLWISHEICRISHDFMKLNERPNIGKIYDCHHCYDCTCFCEVIIFYV